MKLYFVKVLPILLLVFVGVKGAIALSLSPIARLIKSSDDVHTALPSLVNIPIDLIEESTELKSEISALKETVQPQIESLVNSSPHQMSQLAENLNKSVRNIPKLYTSCVEALQNGADSGIYTLQLPFSGLEPFGVYCLKDPENGPAWTVVQRRQDGSVDFYRNWADYKNGFGNLNGEFFLGLRYIYALTNQLKTQELWIQLADWEGATKTAKYSTFQIGPESSKYNMTELGVYSGNAGNSLSYALGSKFTTKDSNNDITTRNCAKEFKGAWWFRNCMYSDLNGEYLQGELPSSYIGRGIIWFHWRDYYYSNKYSHMALRPSN